MIPGIIVFISYVKHNSTAIPCREGLEFSCPMSEGIWCWGRLGFESPITSLLDTLNQESESHVKFSKILQGL